MNTCGNSRLLKKQKIRRGRRSSSYGSATILGGRATEGGYKARSQWRCALLCLHPERLPPRTPDTGHRAGSGARGRDRSCRRHLSGPEITRRGWLGGPPGGLSSKDRAGLRASPDAETTSESATTRPAKGGLKGEMPAGRPLPSRPHEENSCYAPSPSS